jgi:hypothetical protein
VEIEVATQTLTPWAIIWRPFSGLNPPRSQTPVTAHIHLLISERKVGNPLDGDAGLEATGLPCAVKRSRTTAQAELKGSNGA